MKAYSMDFRQRVIADSDAGLSKTQVARKYRVSASWVRRLKQHRRERGEIAPRPRGRRRWRFDRQRLRELVSQRPDATLAELREALGAQVALSSIWYALRKLKLSYKKSRSAPPSRIGRTWPKLALPGG